MQGGTRGAQQLGAASDIALVVGVASVGRALPGRHEAAGAQLAQVVRHKALGFPDEVAQLTDTSVTPTELVQ